jgi:hypothetical protein
MLRKLRIRVGGIGSITPAASDIGRQRRQTARNRT